MGKGPQFPMQEIQIQISVDAIKKKKKIDWFHRTLDQTLYLYYQPTNYS